MGWTCRVLVQKIEMLQSSSGLELSEGEHIVTIGDGDTEVLRSLDQVLPLMNCGEVARVVLKGRGGDLLACELSLLEITQLEEFLGLDDEQRLRRALRHKERAAALFKESRFVDAFHRFAHAAKDLMCTETILLDGEVSEVQPTLSKLFSNMAECQMRLLHHEEAQDLAQRALALEPKDVKALYRAASASWGLGDTDKANGFLDRLFDIEPKNAAALNLRAKVGEKVAEYEKNYEAMMKRVFALY